MPKPVEIIWKHHDKFKDIIVRLGDFHTICTLLGVIGKRFQDAGLRDLCVGSGVIAEGSIAGVMDGRMYNRAVRLHKLVYEALMRLIWKGFLPWLEATHSANMVHLEETLNVIETLASEVNQASFEHTLQNEACKRIFELFNTYCDYLRSDNGCLSAFWMSYIDLVEILLRLIWASREGNWALHLASIRALIPWCFAYDRLNYARYLPYYYAQMSQLASTHPEVFSEFMEGGFSVQMVQMDSTNPFGRIPVDQRIEETINKDTQTAGGTKGFSLKPAAVMKHYLTAEYRSTYLRQLREATGRSKSKLSHKDLQRTRIKKDEADVQSLLSLMENSWMNPMVPENTNLTSLSTGVLAPPDVSYGLLQACDVGEAAYQVFNQTRLSQHPPAVKLFDKMKKQNLKTFASLTVKKSCGKKAQDIVLKADRNLFSHMILVAENRNVNMREVLSHPLGPVPWALANGDGSLRKTNKASLATELEKHASPVDELPSPSVTIIDGMSLIQKMNGNGKNLLTAGRDGTFPDTPWRQPKSENRCCLRCISQFIHQKMPKEGIEAQKTTSVQESYKWTVCSTVEEVSVLSIKQDQPDSVSVWGMEASTIQEEIEQQSGVCDMWGKLLQTYLRWLGRSGRTEIHTRRSRHAPHLTCETCCKWWNRKQSL